MSVNNLTEFPLFRKATKQKALVPEEKSNYDLSTKSTKLETLRTLATIKIDNKISEIQSPPPVQMTYKERLDKILNVKNRNVEDAKFLYDHLKFTPFCMNFLKEDDYDFNTIIEVLRHMKLEKYPKDGVIIEEGDESNDTAYILISGTVSIYRRKKEFYSHQNRLAERRESIMTHGGGDPEEEKDYMTSRLEIPDTPSKIRKTPDPQEAGTRPGSNAGSRGGSRRGSVIIPKSPTNPNSGEVETRVPFIDLDSSPRNAPGSRSGSRRGSVIEATDSVVMSRRSSIEANMMPLTPTLLMNRKKKGLISTETSEHGPKPFKKSAFQNSSYMNDSADMSPDRSPKNEESDKKMSNFLKFLTSKDQNDPTLLYGEYKGDISEKGQIFGEIALEKKIKRTATIYCKEEVQVLTIKKEYYDTISKKHIQEEAEKEHFVFNSFPFLDQVSSVESKREIMQAFRLKEYVRNNFPITEGEIGQDILLIYQGEVKLTRTVIVESDAETFEGPEKVHKLFRGKVTEKEELCLGFFGRGMIFGEEVLALKNTPYFFTLKVVSDTAKIFRVSKSALRLKVPFETSRVLRSNFIEKKEEMDLEILEELDKRKLLVFDNNLDRIPLITHRMQLKSYFIPKTEKINQRIKAIDSLKLIAGQYNPEFLQTITSAFKKPVISPKKFENFRPFSRFNFLPPTHDQKTEMMETNPEVFTNFESVKLEKRHHYMSTTKSPKNIDEYLEGMDKKFNITENNKHVFDNVTEVRNFKFEFGSEEEEVVAAKLHRFKKAANANETMKSTIMSPLSPKTPQNQTALAFRSSLRKYALPLLSQRNSDKKFAHNLFSPGSPTPDLPNTTRTEMHTKRSEYQLVTGINFTTEITDSFDSMLLQSLNMIRKSPEPKKLSERSFLNMKANTNKYSGKQNIRKLIAKTKERVRESKQKIEELNAVSRSNISPINKSHSFLIGSLKSVNNKTVKEVKITLPS